ncbi:MAG TPA: type II toxin-antitoxin system death-on-curing family toxin [Chloroflexota bacterium]|nr:type II toxin-antitoxin system death-on-curing family toxin [Chloroflexota bacterium]
MEIGVHYLTRDDVLVLHALIVRQPVSDVQDTLRAIGLLDSALGRPQNAAAYESASLTRQAATLLCGLIKNHPFRDGNKRTAYVAMQAFLRGNGLTIRSSDDDQYELIVAVATGRNGVDDVERWLNRTTASWPFSP